MGRGDLSFCGPANISLCVMIPAERDAEALLCEPRSGHLLVLDRTFGLQS